MANAKQFSLELMEWGKDLKGKKAIAFLKKVTLEVYSRVTLKSPVDTGRFRGNWMIGIGAANESTLGIHTPGDAKAENLRQEAIVFTITKLQNIHISNNLDYGAKLEHGTSKQAPQGMVGITLSEIETHFNATKEV